MRLRTSHSWLVALALTCVAVTTGAHAQDQGLSTHPFPQNTKRIAVALGTGFSQNDTYLILGAGVGYYVVDGLELAIDTDLWLFSTPTIFNLTPGVRYLFDTRTRFVPYIGAFYRYAAIDDFEDQDSLGGRAGVALLASPNVSATVGLVYEHILDCNETWFRSCDSLYPEIAALFYF
jgi:hypothetical protein